MTDLDSVSWTRVCGSDDIGVGARREAMLDNGQLVLVVRTADFLRACPADCPHQETPLLDEGIIEGNILTCPTHFWQWDLATGEPLGGAEMKMPLFVVREDVDGIFVGRAASACASGSSENR